MAKKKKIKARKKNSDTRIGNDGHKKIERIKIELKRNPNNNLAAKRLAELKEQHKNKK